MGEVGIGKLGIEVAIDTNRAIRQMHYDQVEAEQRRLAAERAAAVPPDAPDLSERWNKNLFGKISEHEGFFEEY